MSTAPTRLRARLAIPALVAVLVGVMTLGVALGAVRLSLGDIISALSAALSGGDAGMAGSVVLGLRLPRVILAALVGVCLATAGVLYQALFRNPLADPYILGVSSGAGLGATIAIVAGIGGVVGRVVGVPFAAFVGALVTIVVVVRLATRNGRVDATSLLLAGVAVSYILAAITSFLMVVSRESMAVIVFWMMGGLTDASWEYVAILTPMTLVGLAFPALVTRELDVMLLGDQRAGHLGVPVERFKLAILGVASLLVAGAVSVSGLIGFVGLMTPHMVRLAIGPSHRLLLPATALAGACVMVGADLLARVVLAPIEIPVGIVTAVAGGPFFLWLLLRKEAYR